MCCSLVAFWEGKPFKEILVESKGSSSIMTSSS